MGRTVIFIWMILSIVIVSVACCFSSSKKANKNPKPTVSPPNPETYLPEDCGKRTSASESPWMAMLYSDKVGLIEFWVTVKPGILISKRYAITSSAGSEGRNYRLVVGESRNPLWEEDFANLTYRNARLGERLIHHHFDDTIMENNSIALWRLEEEFIFNDSIQPICLPLAAELRSSHPQDFTIYGADPDYINRYSKLVAQPGSRMTPPMSWMDFTRSDDVVHLRGRESEECRPVLSLTSFQHGEKEVFLGLGLVATCESSEVVLLGRIENHMGWLLENLNP